MNRCQLLTATGAAGLAGPAAAQGREELPFRQVHFDFHTSELIHDAGADFDAGESAATLKTAHPNSIDVFAKGHHGYAYYDSKIATRHPALKIDRLGQMLDACHVNAQRRIIVHLLHYPMTRRAPDIDIIEEPGVLLEQELRVRVEAAPKRVMLVPQNKSLPFRFENGYGICCLDKVVGHQAISVE